MKFKDILLIIKDLVDSGYGEDEMDIIITDLEGNRVADKDYELQEDGYLYIKLK